MDKIIVIAGMIAVGKTSASEIIAEALESEVFYEPVDENPFLERFYLATEEESKDKRYPFLLQLYFLDMRFKLIKEAYHSTRNVLDRSIYEDWYFAKINNEIGDISDDEFFIYENLLENMMKEIEALPQKAPDLLVYLHAPFELIMKRINLRGRDFEQDEDLVAYYRKLWEGYDDWVDNHYKASDVLKIDVSDLDYVNNKNDAEYLSNLVINRLEKQSSIEGATIL